MTKIRLLSLMLAAIVLALGIGLVPTSVITTSAQAYSGSASAAAAGDTSDQVHLPMIASNRPRSTPTPKLTRTPTATRQPSATPTSPPNVQLPPATGWWQPTPNQPIHWHWQLSDNFAYPRDVLPNVTVYDLDGELTSAQTVAQLHALGPNIKVVCYIEAGALETYRSDASRFPKSVIGNAVDGWAGHYWLDIRQTSIVLPLIRDRMQRWCKDKGFDAVEPDDTEVWTNNPGFPITKAQNNAYNQQIAAAAHALGLSVGLKSNTAEAPELWPYFDWALNEECWQYKECAALQSSFLANGKAVFNIEYSASPDCAKANAWHMNSAKRDLDLVGPTNSQYRYTPCVANSKDTW